MSGSTVSPRRMQVGFGVFEFDPRTGELRKAGTRVRLSGQPATVLALLVARPGELVTREELRGELWPGETFVDFERNLNSAIKRLRAALGDSGETPRFIETLPRRGYRFLLPVRSSDEPVPPDHPAGAPPATWRRSRTLAASVALAACVTVLVALVALPRPARQYDAIAVLPFVLVDGESVESDSLAFGVAEALITELSSLEGPRVISQTSSLRYRGSGKPLPQIARELGVDAVVEGSIQREADRVRITVQLIDAETDAHLWAESYEREIGSVLAVADDVARAVARAIHVRVAGPEAVVAPATDVVDPPDVALAYLRGRYHLSRGNEADFSRARSYFEEALALDPSHAPSHAGLADYFIVTDALPVDVGLSNARTHARQALTLDEHLPDAHTSLAFVHFYADWDWEAAERAFERALALNGRHVRALRWYGLFLSAMGRHDEAIERVEAALAIDPLAIVNHDAAATVRFAARDFAASTAIGRAISELDAFDVRAYEHQALGLIQLGQAPAALALAERGLSTTGPSIVLELIRSVSLARMGQLDDATRAFERMSQGTGSAEVSPVFKAIALLSHGAHDRAIEELERAHARHDPYLVLLRVSPWFAALRETTRFQRLYARMQFPERPSR